MTRRLLVVVDLGVAAKATRTRCLMGVSAALRTTRATDDVGFASAQLVFVASDEHHGDDDGDLLDRCADAIAEITDGGGATIADVNGSAPWHIASELAQDEEVDVIWLLSAEAMPAPTSLVEMLRHLGDDTAGVDGRQLPVELPTAYDVATGRTDHLDTECVVLRCAALRSLGDPADGDAGTMERRLIDGGWELRHVPGATVFRNRSLDDHGRPDVDEVDGVARRFSYR